MLQKIKAYVKKQNMLREGDRIVVGVSGGADSVCLFHVLLELKKEFALELAVVHVNHGIRKEAQVDEAYVEKLCARHGIAFYPFHANVAQIAKKEQLGEEEAGRQVRYRAFAQVLEQVYGNDGKIAVAHTQNDRAETVLFHLFRGTGLTGLAGIAPVREQIIRPLLCVSREDVEQYLSERGIAFCQDATNDTDAYTRNRIRHHILPYVETEICREPVRHINQTAEQLSEASDYLRQKLAEAVAETIRYTGDGAQIALEQWNRLHPYLQKEVIHEVFKNLTPAAKDITSTHVEQVCELFEKQTGRRLDLPYGIVAKRNYAGVLMRQENTTAGSQNEPGQAESILHKSQAGESCLLITGTEGCGDFGGYEIRWRVFPNEKGEDILKDIPKNNCTKWFDYDRINKSITFRYRKTGDFIVINEQGGTKRIKEYMIHEKIPSEKRSHIPLLADGDCVLWVTGYRIGENAKISSQTKTIIEIQIAGGNENG